MTFPTRTASWALSLSAALTTLVPPASAQAARLVEDFFQEAEGEAPDSDSDPGQFRRLGDRAVFFATNPHTGRELWATDGTPGETEMLVDVCPGRCSAGIYYGQIGGIVLWTGPPQSPMTYDGIWRTDGTREGTYLLRPGPVTDPLLFNPKTANGFLIFSALDADSSQNGVWRTDGTPAGTYRVSEETPALFEVDYEVTARLGSEVYFLDNRSLWKTDGTVAGTAVEVEVLPLIPDGLLEVEGRILLFGTSVTEGTSISSYSDATGFHPVTGIPNSADWLFDPPFVVDGSAFFQAADERDEHQLWRVSEGRALKLTAFENGIEVESRHVAVQGTRIVLSLGNSILASPAAGLPFEELTTTCQEPQACSSFGPASLVRAGNRLTFTRRNQDAGIELWATDGSPEGTEYLADVCSGSCSRSSQQPISSGSQLYFRADFAEVSRPELWVSDGTPEGTRRLARLSDPEGLRLGRHFQSASETPQGILFSHTDLRAGREPWVASLSGGGAHLLFNVNPTLVSSRPSELTSIRGRLLVSATTGYGDRSRFRHEVLSVLEDGTSVRRIFGPIENRLTIQKAASYGYFVSVDQSFPPNFTVFSTDGRPERTAAILEVTGGQVPGLSISIAEIGDMGYFALTVGDQSSLWRTDGTASGTLELYSLEASGYSVDGGLHADGDRLFFLGWPQPSAGVLFVGDADGSEVVPLGEVLGTEEGDPSSLVFDQIHRVGDDTYFKIHRRREGTSIWRTNGPGGDLLRIWNSGNYLAPDLELALLHGKIYFTGRADRSSPGGTTSYSGLWLSDGTTEGTGPILEFPTPVASHEIEVLGDFVYLILDDGEHGPELWQSDGSLSGTRLVKDVTPGPESTPGQLTGAGATLFFTADDGIHGRELWRSDGTEEGTRLVHDINPGPQPSLPEHLTVSGTNLFFTADDGITGRELWVLPLNSSGPPCRASQKTLCLQEDRFQVEVHWKDFQGNEGTGTAVPLTTDTGYFWFFNDENVEAILKVLDGRSNNGHFWSFYGALSNVEYYITVTDALTGLTRRYFNPPRTFASVGDTRSFGPLGANSTASPDHWLGSGPPQNRWKGWSREPKVLQGSQQQLDRLEASGVGPGAVEAVPAALPFAIESHVASMETCAPSPTRLCLNNGRFAVEAIWEDFSGNAGNGTAVSLTDDTGYFWFFRDTNVETVLKVLDGRANNGNFWVFYGSLSNVDFDLRVTDTVSGRVKTYQNRGRTFASVGDTAAFPGE